jgi:hypothetical protein
MTTKRESILAAIATALAGTTGVSTRIYRSRTEAFTRAESPALLIEPVQDIAQQMTLNNYEWSLLVRVTVIARGDIPDQQADATIQSLHSKISADLTLGGLCQDVQAMTVQYDFLDGDQPMGLIACDYNIKYRTVLNDLTQ